LSLPRRDLFDARFQLISHNADDLDGSDQPTNTNAQSALQFLNAPSDLVPLVYEGGLKTWECSLDLASYLDSISSESQFDVRGKRMLEVRISFCSDSRLRLFVFSDRLWYIDSIAIHPSSNIFLPAFPESYAYPLPGL
jgi:hypothetical protein